MNQIKHFLTNVGNFSSGKSARHTAIGLNASGYNIVPITSAIAILPDLQNFGPRYSSWMASWNRGSQLLKACWMMVNGSWKQLLARLFIVNYKKVVPYHHEKLCIYCSKTFMQSG